MVDGGFMWSGQDQDVTQKISETRDMEEKIKDVGQAYQITIVLKLLTNKDNLSRVKGMF